jgi:hypothetical protein
MSEWIDSNRDSQRRDLSRQHFCSHGANGNAPMQQSIEAQSSIPELEAEVDEAIRICGGDVRAALRATLVANAYLETEVERLTDAISTGFPVGGCAGRHSE